MAANQIQTEPRDLVHKGFDCFLVMLTQPILNFDEQIKREMDQAVKFTTPTQHSNLIWILILLVCCVFAITTVLILKRKVWRGERVEVR